MTTPDGLTAESEALVNWALDVFYEDRPFVSEQLGDMLRAIEAAAVARHVRETGCDGLREALEWVEFALGWAVFREEPRIDNSNEMRDIRARIRAALAPTVAASEACRPAALPHHWPASRERQDEAGNMTTETYCWRCGIALAPTVAASEAPRPLTPGEIRAANDIMRALGAPIPPEAPTLAAVKVKDCACNESSNCFAHPNAPSPATEADPVQQAIDDPIRWLRRMATDAGATPMTPPPDAVAALEAAHHVDDMGLFDGEVTLAALIAAGWSLSHDSERRSAVIGSERSDNEALVAALEDMIGLATHGAARDHLDQAGVMQDPPHGWGKYAECEAPWCVRNQKRIAAARAAIEGRP